MEISVVLPAPLGPSRPKNSPRATLKLTPASASTLPKRRATSTTSTAASIAPVAASGGAAREVVHPVHDRERLQRGGQVLDAQDAALAGGAPAQRHHNRERGRIGVREPCEIEASRIGQ